MYRKMLLVVAAIEGAAVVFTPTGASARGGRGGGWGRGGFSRGGFGRGGWEEDMAGAARPSALALVSGWPEAIRIIGVLITTEAVLTMATVATVATVGTVATAGDAGGE